MPCIRIDVIARMVALLQIFPRLAWPARCRQHGGGAGSIGLVDTPPALAEGIAGGVWGCRRNGCRRIDTMCATAVKDGAVPGVAVARAARLCIRKAFGLADNPAKRSLQSEHFQIA
ncbi:MAG: hypothetical protein U1G07_15075 [Verrucomicrobiota bacterium]